MTNSLDIEKCGVYSLDEKQMEEIVAGNIFKKIYLAIVGAAITVIVNILVDEV